MSGSWDRTVRVWNKETGELVRTLEGHSGVVTSVAVAGARIASTDMFGVTKHWDLHTGSELEGHPPAQESAALAEAGVMQPLGHIELWTDASTASSPPAALVMGNRAVVWEGTDVHILVLEGTGEAHSSLAAPQ